MEFPYLMSDCSHMRRKDKADELALSPERRGLLRVVEDKGEDLANLSKAIGRNHAYLNQYIWRGTPAKLDEEDRAKLATILKVDEESLKPGRKPQLKAVPVDNSRNKVAGENQSGLVSIADAVPVNLSGPRDLPILGYVKAGELGFFVDNGQRQGVAVRPENLIGVEAAYAVYVHDDSMFPALEPGWLLHVDPTRPAVPGDNVVIQFPDGQAFIKRLVRRTARVVTCKQWNPAKEIEYKTDVVIHPVVGTRKK